MLHSITVTDRTPLKDEQQWLLSPRAAAQHIMWWNRLRPCLRKVDKTTFSDCLSLICRNIIPIILRRRRLPVSITFTPATPFIHPTSVSLAPHFSSYTVALTLRCRTRRQAWTHRAHTLNWEPWGEVRAPPSCLLRHSAVHCKGRGNTSWQLIDCNWITKTCRFQTHF